MKPTTFSVLLLLAVPLAASAQGPAQDPQVQNPGNPEEIRLWIGQLSPAAKSDFWDDNFQNFTATRNRLDGIIFGGDYLVQLNPHSALMFSGSLYDRSFSEPDRNGLDESGNPLEHHLEIGLGSLTAGYVLFPAGIDHALIPYLGAGAGVYGGIVETFRHEFVTTDDNCDDETSSCTTTQHVGDQRSGFVSLGYFFVAGLEVPVSRHVALLVDGRYTFAHANLGGDFKSHGQLDLSGGQVTTGFAVRF